MSVEVSTVDDGYLTGDIGASQFKAIWGDKKTGVVEGYKQECKVAKSGSNYSINPGIVMCHYRYIEVTSATTISASPGDYVGLTLIVNSDKTGRATGFSFVKLVNDDDVLNGSGNAYILLAQIGSDGSVIDKREFLSLNDESLLDNFDSTNINNVITSDNYLFYSPIGNYSVLQSWIGNYLDSPNGILMKLGMDTGDPTILSRGSGLYIATNIKATADDPYTFTLYRWIQETDKTVTFTKISGGDGDIGEYKEIITDETGLKNATSGYYILGNTYANELFFGGAGEMNLIKDGYINLSVLNSPELPSYTSIAQTSKSSRMFLISFGSDNIIKTREVVDGQKHLLTSDDGGKKQTITNEEELKSTTSGFYEINNSYAGELLTGDINGLLFSTDGYCNMNIVSTPSKGMTGLIQTSKSSRLFLVSIYNNSIKTREIVDGQNLKLTSDDGKNKGTINSEEDIASITTGYYLFNINFADTFLTDLGFDYVKLSDGTLITTIMRAGSYYKMDITTVQTLKNFIITYSINSDNTLNIITTKEL